MTDRVTVRVPAPGFLARVAPLTLLTVALVTTLVTTACGSAYKLPVAGAMDADVFLFARGNESMTAKKWLTAREYFRRLVDGYPQSRHRQDAKIGIGDSFIGEDSVESNILAINEFREFLTFFPTSQRADYAQYRIALAYTRQMLAADRDQTATKDALRELDAFLQRYPDSKYREDVVKLERETRDRLSESEYRVGYFYARFNVCPGAIDRFKGVIQQDPAFTRRDAVYFQMAECILKMGRPAEALPWYERLLVEFEKSEYLDRAKKRVAELKKTQ